MKTDKRTRYLTREDILKLLSDEEVARVSTEEAQGHVAEGDEYIDLEQPQRGVRQADGVFIPSGRVLLRKSVHIETWSRILTQLDILPIPKARWGS